MSGFNKMLNSVRDRNWGGTSQNIAAEPYLTGYSFIKWHLPASLSNFLNKNLAQDLNDQTVTTQSNISSAFTLESAMTSVTPPGGTINRAEYSGLGGVKWSVPTSMDYGDSISIRYIEFSGLPILRIHRTWFNMIRDNKIGLTALKGSTQSSELADGFFYNKANYSATLLYWTTKPDGVTVEFAAAYSGIFPTKDPHDIFVGDITSIDKVEIDMEYNVDRIYQEDWVWQLAREEAKKKPYGKKDSTLWSRDGFRYSGQKEISKI
jgi:hypothetical protein